MISDTLSDAVEDIRRYQTDPAFAGVYDGEGKAEIDFVVTQMEVLRKALDAADEKEADQLWRQLRETRIAATEWPAR